MEDIVELAKEKNIMILSDEVYRPVFHSISPISPDFPPSLLSMGYEGTIATGSMSKAYSLAGIRVGWIASRSTAAIKKIYDARQQVLLPKCMYMVLFFICQVHISKDCPKDEHQLYWTTKTCDYFILTVY